jgi:hypothetical protein
MNKGLLKKSLSTVIILIIFYFLLSTLLENWDEFSKNIHNFNPLYLLLSIIFLIFFYLIHSYIWKDILKELGYRLSFIKTLKIRSLSEIGRYTPGKIWHVLGRIYFSKKVKIPTATTIVSMVIETLLMIFSTTILFLIFIKNIQEINLTYLLIILITIFFIILIIKSKRFNKILNKILFKLNKTSEPIKISISSLSLLKFFGYYLISWSAIGVAFFYSIKLFYPSLSFIEIPTMISIFAISWVLGFISLLTPGGLGVREGVMTILLANYVTLSIAIVSPIIMRFLTIFVELIMATITVKVKLVEGKIN